MAFKVTTLMENTSPKGYLMAEHGLSLLIEGEGYKFLYDTGPSPSFLMNARTLGADLTGLDALVLSHGHYDHTGGAAALIAGSSKPAALYVGEGFFRRRYVRRKDGLQEIGSALEEVTVEQAKIPRMQVGKEPLALAEGIWLVSQFKSTDEMERPAPNMIRVVRGQMEQDLFDDEVAVVLDTKEGLVLMSGCAHVGVISMCEQVEERFGRPVTMFIGGTHLKDVSDERIEHTCRRLQEKGLTRLGACHCSGDRAGLYFEKHFPGFFRNNVGSCVVLE